ncbi:MAG: DUF2283 domain-containing protein [bacterium]|nr:DUF2283 domain-containing protein [bacterium]
MKKNKLKLRYEPDADVLSWEVSAKPIDFAEEIGNMVVHFSKDNTPVLFEILDASSFIKKADNLVREEFTANKRMTVPVSR